MSDQNSNAQTPPAPPAPPAGPTMEELNARMVELEKAREGLIRDVQDERRKRQELEARVNPPAPAPSAAQNDAAQDELYKVVAPVIDKHPLARKLAETSAQLQRYEEDKALDVIAAKLGKAKQDVMADQKFQDRFLATQKRWGVSGSNLVDLTTKTLELMDLEDTRQKEAERSRQAQAQTNASMPNGTPPAPNAAQKTISKEDFEKMSMLDYDKLASSGNFVQDEKTGDIVYTPR